MLHKRLFIKVNGIVQGVGFRPFVYNLALKNNLNGWVNNNSLGVFIDIEGEEGKLNIFLEVLRNSPPPLAIIESISIEEKDIALYSSFSIKESKVINENITLISPDIATCEDCKKDIFNSQNRRYRYPFTNCTNCGPRFSIIKEIPYDRDKTTMKDFKMCTPCEAEYKDPSNRRFHAQPNACDVCGPKVWLEDNKGNIISATDPISWAVEELKKGKIFAIKGLSGFHLACDAKNETAVKELRQRKNRPYKPFAVMMRNEEEVSKYCEVNKEEKNLLTGIERPIVILNTITEEMLPHEVAPNQKSLGVMLPYTPLQELIFNEDIDVLVMTSANLNGLPLEYLNEEARVKLKNMVDYFLFHNRDIYIPLDDSVVKVVDDKMRMIRRARGYVPKPITYKGIKSVLACGSNMKNTFSISKDNFIFISQHNGDLENIETYEHFKNNITHLKNIFSIVPETIAYDMHPNYMSTNFGIEEAKKLNILAVPVQHHHAHIVGCMLENNLNEDVIGISFDGTGYGTDGKIWGGEILECNYKSFKRLAHLNYVRLPGGEKAILEPWRIAVSYIYDSFEEPRDIIEKLYNENSTSIIKMLEKNINCPETSSMGRFFDAVSSIIGVRNYVTYEGQASIELENIISQENIGYYSFSFTPYTDSYIIETREIIRGIVSDKLNNILPSIISSKFHNTVIKFTTELSLILSKKTGLKKVVMSGGVFQNSYILKGLIHELSESGLEVYTNSSLPSNDGGVSVGQLVIASNFVDPLSE